MFFHIGGSHIVFAHELIGIFDYNLIADIKNENLRALSLGDSIRVTSSSEHEKSIVITDHNTYISPISPSTLCRRHNYSLKQ